MEGNEKKTLTQKDLSKAYWRMNLFPMCTINYERFAALQYCNALLPIVKKLYPGDGERDKKERIEMCQRHMKFFNTTPIMNNFPLGITIAQEEKIASLPDGEERESLKQSVNAIKASLMGPLAGVGDSLQTTIVAILGAIAAGFSTDGSLLGPIIYLIGFNLFYFGISIPGFKGSYVNGSKAVTDMNKSGVLQRLMDAATILGLTSLGSLIPNWVGFNLDKTLILNAYEVNIQTELNNIFPGLVPLLLTLLMAYLYKKKVSPTKLVLIVFILALAASLLGFGY